MGVMLGVALLAALNMRSLSEHFGPSSTGPLEEELQKRTEALIKALLEMHPNDPRTKRLQRRWTGRIHNLSASHDQAAKTINKSIVYVCQKDEHGRVYDTNTAMFVLIHELAHVATETIGHDDAFWENMRFLLDIAVKSDLYRYEDYSHRKRTYCGQSISGNPYACVLQGRCKVV